MYLICPCGVSHYSGTDPTSFREILSLTAATVRSPGAPSAHVRDYFNRLRRKTSKCQVFYGKTQKCARFSLKNSPVSLRVFLVLLGILIKAHKKRFNNSTGTSAALCRTKTPWLSTGDGDLIANFSTAENCSCKYLFLIMNNEVTRKCMACPLVLAGPGK